MAFVGDLVEFASDAAFAVDTDGRRLRPIQAKNRSTTQRRGLTVKPT